MKYLFEVQDAFGSTLVEYDTSDLSNTITSKEYVVYMLRKNNNYYENVKVSKGVFDICNYVKLPDIEMQLGTDYIKVQGGNLFVYDNEHNLWRYELSCVGKRLGWRLAKEKDIFIECSTERAITIECTKKHLVESNIKSLEQVRRIILLRG